MFQKATSLTGDIIAAAIGVHRDKGPGLIESIYERCFIHELSLWKLPTVSQAQVSVVYKDLVFEEPLRFDVLVDGCVLVELKAVQHVLPIHKAQLLNYMKLINVPIGLVVNFHEMKLVDGVYRLILPGANEPEP